MLSTYQLTALIRRKLERGGGKGFLGPEPDSLWPLTIGLKVPAGRKITTYEELPRWCKSIRSYCAAHGFECREEGKYLGYIGTKVPTAIVVPDERSAARAVGMQSDIARRDERLRALSGLALPDPTCREVVMHSWKFGDLDYGLIIKAGMFAREHDTTGMTPRSLPIPGVQGKLLENGDVQKVVALIARKDTLGLARHALRISVKYLDPDTHVGFGEILPDSRRLCDLAEPQYPYDLVFIVENRETFVDFPCIPKAACVLGDGKACLAALHHVPWVTNARRIIYWGDMDMDGLEILSGLRQRGLRCESIAMDLPTFLRFEELGTSVDKQGRVMTVTMRPDARVGLLEGELALYDALAHHRLQYSRIEQEKIPYEVALEEFL